MLRVEALDIFRALTMFLMLWVEGYPALVTACYGT